MDESALLEAVQAKTEALQKQLLAKVEANLSGDILQTRTGSLKASIGSTNESSAGVIVAGVSSTGVPYAAIQEYGGTTAPHEILPIKATALAIAGGFARRVRHPGSVLPARAYLGNALDALHGEIASGLKEAVRTALGIDR